MTTPAAFNPTGPVVDLYRAAEVTLLRALSTAVADTLAHPESRALVERRLRRDTLAVVAALNRAVPDLIDTVLDDARREGLNRARTE